MSDEIEIKNVPSQDDDIIIKKLNDECFPNYGLWSIKKITSKEAKEIYGYHPEKS